MPLINYKRLINKIELSLGNPLIKSMVTVGIITFFIKAIAFYKETVIAGSFGMDEVLDSFFLAILVPVFIQGVFIGSITNLFIPNYIAEIKSNGSKSSFQSLVFLMTIIISLFSALITLLFSDIFLEVIYPNHSTNFYQLTKDQLYVILPSLFFWGLSSVIVGLLEIENRFFISTVSNLFPLLTMLFFLLYLKDYFGDMVLAFGTLAGSVVGLLFLLFFAIKNRDLSLSRPKINSNARMMIKELPPKISSGFLSAMNNFIDQFFAGQLVAGSLAALNYGNRVPAFGITITIMALGNVLLPHFSRLVNEDLTAAYHFLFKTLKLVLGTGILLTIVAIFMSDWIIEVWLERDMFTHQDTLKVSAIQQILLVNVPFYLCTLVIVKFLTSINKNSFMAWISLFNLIINIILNIILIKYYDVYGLAISTSFVLILSSCFYFGFTYNQYRKLNS